MGDAGQGWGGGAVRDATSPLPASAAPPPCHASFADRRKTRTREQIPDIAATHLDVNLGALLALFRRGHGADQLAEAARLRAMMPRNDDVSDATAARVADMRV